MQDNKKDINEKVKKASDRFLDDPDMPDDDEEEGRPPRHPALALVWKIVRYTFWFCVAAVIGILLWRAFFSTNLTEGISTIYADEKLQSSYSAWLNDTDEDKEPFAIYQKYWLKRCMTTTDKDEEEGIIGNYGYFGIPDCAIFKSAGEIQFVFRYNKSTLEHLAEDYSLPEVPGEDGDYYVVKLRVVTDNTPGDTTDDDTSEKTYDCVTVSSDTTSIYCYRQMHATGIDNMDNLVAVYADIYYKEDIDETRPYGTITLFTNDEDSSAYALDKDDQKALKGK